MQWHRGLDRFWCQVCVDAYVVLRPRQRQALRTLDGYARESGGSVVLASERDEISLDLSEARHGVVLVTISRGSQFERMMRQHLSTQYPVSIAVEDGSVIRGIVTGIRARGRGAIGFVLQLPR